MQEMITAGTLGMHHMIVSVMPCNIHYKSITIKIHTLLKRCFCVLAISYVSVPVNTVGHGADLAAFLQ